MCTEGVFLQKKRESPGWGEINPSSSRSARDRYKESLAFIHMYTALVSSRFIFRGKNLVSTKAVVGSEETETGVT